MKKFRPQSYNGRFRLSCFRKGIFVGAFNWHKHCDLTNNPHGFMLKIAEYLHHKGSHAPDAVRVKWRNAERKFHKRVAIRGSMRFIGKYTADRWL